MSLSAHRLVIGALLLGVLLATLIAAPPAATAAQLDVDIDASGSALGVPTADPTIYTVTVAAVGLDPTLGTVRVAANHVTDVTTGTFANGVLTLTLGGGETISGTYSGTEFATADPATIDVEGDVVFSGGTGRFQRASGKGTFSGQLTIRKISPAGVVREAVTLQFDGRVRF